MVFQKKWFNHQPKLIFGIFIIFYLGGSLMYYFLMIRQFIAHDYYFVDTFLGPLIASILYVTKYQKFKFDNKTQLIIVLYIMASLQIGVDWQRRLYDKQNMGHDEIFSDFEHSDELLDSLDIASNAHVAILPIQSAPGMPGILMKRKAFRANGMHPYEIKDLLARNFDVLIVPKRQQSVIVKTYPQFNKGLYLFFSNDKLDLYKKTSSK